MTPLISTAWDRNLKGYYKLQKHIFSVISDILVFFKRKA